MKREQILGLAAQMGISSEQLEALKGADLTQLLAATNGDPTQAVLMNWLIDRAEGADEGGRTADAIEPPRPRRRSAASIVRRLRRELQHRMEMLDWVASVVGCCQACLGQSRFCETCRGRGMPGAVDFDADELVAWVGPALERVGFRIAPAGPRAVTNSVAVTPGSHRTQTTDV